MTAAQRAAARLRWTAAVLLSVCGVLTWLRRRRARLGRIPVLMFHRIAGDARYPEPRALPTALFAGLVSAAGRRYRLASWEEAVAAASVAPREPHLLLTFDDGYADQAGTAWPLVRAAGGSAVFFVTAGPAAGPHRFWWDVVAAWHQRHGHSPGGTDRSGTARFSAAAMAEIATLQSASATALQARVRDLEARLGAGVNALPRSLSWADVRQLAAEGAVLGGHGVSHAILTACSEAELATEVDGSQSALSHQCGGRVELFAYPNGDHDARVGAAVQRAGFRWGFTTERGYLGTHSDPLRVPRIDVSVAMCTPNGVTFSWALFEAELLGVFETLLLRGWRRTRAQRRAARYA